MMEKGKGGAREGKSTGQIFFNLPASKVYICVSLDLNTHGVKKNTPLVI